MRSVLALLILAAAGSLPAAAAERPPGLIRIATFNCSLNRASEGELRRDLATPDDAQARAVAEIIQRVRPDILLLQEFDFDAAGESLRDFQANYLARSQNGAAPLEFAYSFLAESNTGVPSGFDFDRNGSVGGGGDALGFGEFPGQYGMVVLSRFPIDAKGARTFRKFLWRDMPGALLPDDAATPAAADWYSPAELAVLPLSSKSHWDLPVRIGGVTLHLLASHPTPPAFDGAEDRNGKRNHDEIRFWNDYLTTEKSGYIRDDQGGRGGFKGKAFIIMGDQNSDPVDGASLNDAIDALLANPRLNSQFVPQSGGAIEASAGAGRRQCRATRRPALRHRRLQRSCRRQPARGLSTAVEGPAGLRGRRVLAGASRSDRRAGVGRSPAAELRSPPRVARRQLQTELNAHGAVIRKPVTLRIIIIEDHAHEGFLQHALREIASQQDVVDELAVLAVLRAGREFRGARDVGEFRGRRELRR